MWHLIGVDEDGTRHHCNQCATEEEANRLLSEAPEKHRKMCEPYLEALFSAELEYKAIQKMPKQFRPLTSDYEYFKMQCLYVDHFELEYREDDY
jgi:hypothetical protein